ncbi:MAG: glutamate racemase [Eubacteriales bacterium]
MIGIFDSGLGGLTAFAVADRLFPRTDILYAADPARVPYGDRPAAQLQSFIRQAAHYFKDSGAEFLLLACGTLSVNLSPGWQPPLPVVGIVEPSVAAACRATRNRKIAVAATAATTATRSFTRRIQASDPAIQTLEIPCPLFAPLVEKGLSDRDYVKNCVAESLRPALDFGADTLILGCTHYPWLSEAIAAYLPGVTLINSGAEAAKSLPTPATAEQGRREFRVTGDTEVFRRNAARLLGEFPWQVEPLLLPPI